MKKAIKAKKKSKKKTSGEISKAKGAAIVLIIVGTILTIAGVYNMINRTPLGEKGVFTNATIEEKSDYSGISVSGQPTRTYFLTLSFMDTANHWQKQDMEVHPVFWKNVIEGETVEIAYMPDDPKNIALAQNTKKGEGEAGILIITGIAAIAIGSILWFFDRKE